MANTTLPKQIDPIQLADNKISLLGKLQLSEMDRLGEVIFGESTAADIELRFDYDALDYPYIRGSIQTNFQVICQRCNTPMELLLNISVNASPIRTDEEADQLPNEYDPLLLTGDTLSLVTMIEEEILLSIPLVPKHLPDECQVKTTELIEWEEKQDVRNPFEVLKKFYGSE